jgi:hypothetical protein
LSKPLLGAAVFVAAPVYVGSWQVVVVDVVQEDLVGDGERPGFVAGLGGGMGRAGERFVAVVAIRISGEVAAGFGLDFGGRLFRGNHGRDQMAVDLVVAGSERLAEGRGGIPVLAEQAFELPGAEIEPALPGGIERGLAACQGLGDLESFGRHFGAGGGVQALEAAPGERLVHRELGAQVHGQRGGLLVGLRIARGHHQAQRVDAVPRFAALRPDDRGAGSPPPGRGRCVHRRWPGGRGRRWRAGRRERARGTGGR